MIALIGATLVVSPNLLSKADLDLSSLYGIASALFYGAYFLAAQRGRSEMDALSFVQASTLASTLVLLSAALLLNQPLTGYSMQSIGWFLMMGVVVQAAGWLVISYAQGHLPASIVSATLLGQPVLTALFSFWLLAEAFLLIRNLWRRNQQSMLKLQQKPRKKPKTLLVKCLNFSPLSLTWPTPLENDT